MGSVGDIMVQLVKNADSINRIRAVSQAGVVDTGAQYTSSTYARCPFCGGEEFITRLEHGSAYDKAIFRCSSCFHQFEPHGESVLWI